MKPFTVINPEQPGAYYALFYVLAFLIGFVLLMTEGRKRNFPMIPWMMVIATAFLFFMAGCRMMSFSRAEWALVFNFSPITYSTGRTVLGGILFSIPGILLAKKYLRFNQSMIDSFALVLPTALMIERFGCLLAGCCHGIPTALPWGVQYVNGSHAFVQQVQDGLIPAGATLPLPVHPVQLYEIVCCAGIILLLRKLRIAIKAPGNFFLASVGCYGLVRFLLEFVRTSDPGGWNTFLNWTQLVILLITPVLLLFIFLRERTHSGRQRTLPSARPASVRLVIYFVLLGLLLLFSSRWLRPLEIVSATIILMPLLFALAWKLFHRTTIPGYRIATLILPFAALTLMNQTVPEYSKRDSSRLSYFTVSAGAMSGNSSRSMVTEDCSGNSYRTNYKSEFSAKALGIERTIQLDLTSSISFGASGFSGTHHEQISSNVSSDKKYSFSGFKPFIQYDGRKFGIGAGINLGNMVMLVYPESGNQSIEQVSAYPAFSIRYGDLTNVFLEYKIGNHFPTSFPGLNRQFALGFGFGQRNGATLKLGVASYAGFFISGSIPIGNHIIMEPFLGGGGGTNRYKEQASFIGSFSLHYKFGRTEKPMAIKTKP